MASKTISNAATELLARNRLRKSFLVQNEDTSLAIFIKREDTGAPSVSTTDHDHRIGPGGFFGLNTQQDGLENIQGRYTIIAESGTPRISYFETEDIIR